MRVLCVVVGWLGGWFGWRVHEGEVYKRREEEEEDTREKETHSRIKDSGRRVKFKK